jgi:putative endonuclease
LCRWHLRPRGWRVIASDRRCPAGEIDIVARRGGVPAAIGVKSQPDYATGAAAVLPRRQRRTERAIEAFLAVPAESPAGTAIRRHGGRAKAPAASPPGAW